jgi:hypothetical protein
VKPYEIVLTMRRGTADWIRDMLIDHKAASGAYGDAQIEALARGLRVSKTRATLRLPFDPGLLRRIANIFWEHVGLAPFGVATALERLHNELDRVNETSVVDHLVKYVG